MIWWRYTHIHAWEVDILGVRGPVPVWELANNVPLGDSRRLLVFLSSIHIGMVNDKMSDLYVSRLRIQSLITIN